MSCTCAENRDDETGEVSIHYCESCAIANGHCECGCDCGQCLYTDTPCGWACAARAPCRFCLLRQEQVQTEVERRIAAAKEDLTKVSNHGGFSRDYLERKLARLEPCRDALATKGNAAIIQEVKNLLSMEGKTEARRSCGLPYCRCHLQHLTDLTAPPAQAAEIAAATAAYHAACAASSAAYSAWQETAFAKQIAREVVDEAYEAYVSASRSIAYPFYALD